MPRFPLGFFFVITSSKTRLGGRHVILVSTLCFRQRDPLPPPPLKNPSDAPGADRDPLRHNLSQ